MFVIQQLSLSREPLMVPSEFHEAFIEFAADPESPFHNAHLNKDAKIILVCGAGGQAALAGKTLKEMGYESVRNIGGFADWRDAGGATEAA
jgi:rhodanese-related sulfurtransferase